MATYDPKVIQNYAARLYAQAKTTVASWTAMGALVGAAVGSSSGRRSWRPGTVERPQGGVLVLIDDDRSRVTPDATRGAAQRLASERRHPTRTIASVAFEETRARPCPPLPPTAQRYQAKDEPSPMINPPG